MTWEPDKIEALTALAFQGLSSRRIADQLGVSRNSVIGMAHRLGIQLGGALGRRTVWTDERKAQLGKLSIAAYTDGEIGAILGVSRQAVRDQRRRLQMATHARFHYRPSPRPAKTQNLPAVAVAPLDNDPPANPPIRLMDLRWDSCRWPVIDAGGALPIEQPAHWFCGATARGPYCGKHARIAYRL